MPQSAAPAFITAVIHHFHGLRDGIHGGSASRKHKGAICREGSAAVGSRRRPGSQRNKHEFAARHRAADRDRTTRHSVTCRVPIGSSMIPTGMSVAAFL
jgi:hypothetical protein